jgi:queuine/archaeosine tRNA-ribosyltransferase
VAGEPTAGRLITRHNLAWTAALLERARKAIGSAALDDLRASVAAVWR